MVEIGVNNNNSRLPVRDSCVLQQLTPIMAFVMLTGI